jgi:hypothetical protein
VQLSCCVRMWVWVAGTYWYTSADWY